MALMQFHAPDWSNPTRFSRGPRCPEWVQRLAMRRITRQLGAPYTVCEVLLDKFVIDVTKGRKAKRFLRVEDEDRPAGAQLMAASLSSFQRPRCVWSRRASIASTSISAAP